MGASCSRGSVGHQTLQDGCRDQGNEAGLVGKGQVGAWRLAVLRNRASPRFWSRVSKYGFLHGQQVPVFGRGTWSCFSEEEEKETHFTEDFHIPG